jgi:hypothetical protein
VNSNAKKKGLIIWIVIAVLCGGVATPILLRHYRQSQLRRQEHDCVQQMLRLWDCGRSQSVEGNNLFTNQIRMADLAGCFNPRMTRFCPTSGEMYPPFTLLEGPTCPFGHKIQEEVRGERRNEMPAVQEWLWGSRGLRNANAAGQNASLQQTPATERSESSNPPILALWNGGIQMIGEPPFPMFILWADGITVRLVDGQLRQGHVMPSGVDNLMTEIETAGFFSPPATKVGIPVTSIRRVDGPFRRLAAMRNGIVFSVDYDIYSDFHAVGPGAIPSRQQMEAFATMWWRVVHAIDAVSYGKLTDFQGGRELRFPPAPKLEMRTR